MKLEKIIKTMIKNHLNEANNIDYIIKQAKEDFIKNEIYYGSPGHTMKIYPYKIIRLDNNNFEITYALFRPKEQKYENGHFFIISESDLIELMQERTVNYINKNGGLR